MARKTKALINGDFICNLIERYSGSDVKNDYTYINDDNYYANFYTDKQEEFYYYKTLGGRNRLNNDYSYKNEINQNLKKNYEPTTYNGKSATYDYEKYREFDYVLNASGEPIVENLGDGAYKILKPFASKAVFHLDSDSLLGDEYEKAIEYFEADRIPGELMVAKDANGNIVHYFVDICYLVNIKLNDGTIFTNYIDQINVISLDKSNKDLNLVEAGVLTLDDIKQYLVDNNRNSFVKITNHIHREKRALHYTDLEVLIKNPQYARRMVCRKKKEYGFGYDIFYDTSAITFFKNKTYIEMISDFVDNNPQSGLDYIGNLNFPNVPEDLKTGDDTHTITFNGFPIYDSLFYIQQMVNLETEAITLFDKLSIFFYTYLHENQLRPLELNYSLTEQTSYIDLGFGDNVALNTKSLFEAKADFQKKLNEIIIRKKKKNKFKDKETSSDDSGEKTNPDEQTEPNQEQSDPPPMKEGEEIKPEDYRDYYVIEVTEIRLENGLWVSTIQTDIPNIVVNNTKLPSDFSYEKTYMLFNKPSTYTSQAIIDLGKYATGPNYIHDGFIKMISKNKFEIYKTNKVMINGQVISLKVKEGTRTFLVDKSKADAQTSSNSAIWREPYLYVADKKDKNTGKTICYGVTESSPAVIWSAYLNIAHKAYPQISRRVRY